jgi:hypothetical protein
MNNNNIAPKIDDFTQIDATSKGTVRSNWNPNYGYAREKEINEARVKAMEEHILQQAEQNAVFDTKRFLMMEMAIKDLQSRLKALEGK